LAISGSAKSEQNYQPLTGRLGLYNMGKKSQITLRQTLKLIDSLDIISGFDLAPLILLISQKKISGHINIISERNNIYGVSFCDGMIVQIDNRDKKTFIGQLLINDGYLTQDELNTYLQNKNTRIGSDLIQSNRITKDQLIEVLFKQIVLRMSQLINSKPIQVSFTNVEVEKNDVHIEYHELTNLAFDWVFSCFTDQWLKMHYFEQKNYILKFDMDLLRTSFPQVFTQITDLIGKDIVDLFSEKNTILLLEPEVNLDLLHRIIHFCALTDIITIQAPEKTSIEEIDVKLFFNHFKKSSPMEKLNSLAMFTKSSLNETDQIYSRLSDKLMNTKMDIELKNNVLKLALNFLLNPEEMNKAKSTSTQSEIDLLKIKNEAKDLINNQKYFQAFSLLKKLDESQLKSSQIELYALWCLIGHALSSNIKLDQQVIKNRLARIRPEDRFEAEYFYILALQAKYLGQDHAAKQYYIKSCQMNPKFKDFKLFEDRFLVKMKNLFKFSFFVCVLSFASKAQSQIIDLPIKFTNQYYEYTVQENRVQIAGLEFDTTQIDQNIQGLNLIKDKKGICSTATTENAELKICPVARNQTELTVYVMDTVAPNQGTVVLQDLYKFINFKIMQGEETLIEFQTRRRPIAPYKVEKQALEKTTQFTFLDLNNRKNIWIAHLGLDELTFKLQSTSEIYRILQDFVYVKNISENDAIEFTMDLPTELKYSYQRFGLNALAGFSSFTTSTDTFKSVLNSAIGSGIKLLYEHNLDAKTSLYTNLILYTAAVSNERNAITVANKNFTLFDMNLGYKVYYDLNWALSYEFNYRNNFTTVETAPSSGQFEVAQSNSYSIGANPEYTFLESRRWNFVLEFAPSIILPQSTAYGQTQIGYAYEFGIKTTYKLQSARAYAGINYEDRTFNASAAKYKNKNFIYSVGFYYLF
jgi:hypothetical protein